MGRIVHGPEPAVRQVRTDGRGDRLPVGHPDVVAEVVRALVSADVEPPEDVATTPGVGPLTEEAWRASHTALLRLTGAWATPHE
jgi:hypothetical protein